MHRFHDDSGGRFKKKVRYSLDFITLATTLVARVMPGLGMREIMWDIPFCLVGFLIMQERRLAGVKGIGRPEKSRKLWAAWKKIRSEGKNQQSDRQESENRLGQNK